MLRFGLPDHTKPTWVGQAGLVSTPMTPAGAIDICGIMNSSFIWDSI